MDVGPNATRVGVIQYSSQVQSVFPLRAFSRREDMERAIRALVPLAQGTMTGLAIQYAMNVAFSVAEGARPPDHLAMTGASCWFSRAAVPVCGF